MNRRIFCDDHHSPHPRPGAGWNHAPVLSRADARRGRACSQSAHWRTDVVQPAAVVEAAQEALGYLHPEGAYGRKIAAALSALDQGTEKREAEPAAPKHTCMLSSPLHHPTTTGADCERCKRLGIAGLAVETMPPLGKVADCPDCSSVDYCKAHLDAMMAEPVLK